MATIGMKHTEVLPQAYSALGTTVGSFAKQRR